MADCAGTPERPLATLLDAFVYAEIHTQWGNTVKGLEWLERAHRLGGSDLVGLKTDPLLDPLRNEPRFQAVERALNFPD
jgi:hypothetical protein